MRAGQTKDGEDVKGNITIPEVAHDTEEDEYVFDIDIIADATSKQPVKELVRSKITPQLRMLFSALMPALIEEHGKEIQHTPDADPSAGFKAPKYLDHSATKAAAAPSASLNTSPAHVNTTTVTDTEEFRAPATELYQTFTDPARIAAFTRGQPKLFEGAKVGGKFEIFGGNVSGQFKELSDPKKIVQTWRLDQWPKDHYSTLSIEFDQNDVDNVTVMRVEWKGVPIGQEEVTKRNWLEYYIKSIKTTFGYVSPLLSGKKRRTGKTHNTNSWQIRNYPVDGKLKAFPGLKNMLLK